MKTNPVFEKQPSAPTDETVSNDLVKQIRKLRWIGMDGEAEFLANHASSLTSGQCRVGRHGPVLFVIDPPLH